MEKPTKEQFEQWLKDAFEYQNRPRICIVPPEMLKEIKENVTPFAQAFNELLKGGG